MPSENFADLETFEFLMPTEQETDAAFAKVLAEQIDAGLERLGTFNCFHDVLFQKCHC